MVEITKRIVLTEAAFYILLSLYKQPLHGYGIMQQIKEMSHGRVNLGAGTLYGAMSTMQEKGWIENLTTEKKSRKKEYLITDLGKQIVAKEMERLYELIKNGYLVTGIKKGDIDNE